MCDEQLSNHLTSCYNKLFLRLDWRSMSASRLVGVSNDLRRRVEELHNDVMYYSNKEHLTSHQRPSAGFFIDDILRKNTDRNTDTTLMSITSIDVALKECYNSRGFLNKTIASSRLPVPGINDQSSCSPQPEVGPTNTQHEINCRTPRAHRDDTNLTQRSTGLRSNTDEYSSKVSMNTNSRVSVTSLLSEVSTPTEQYYRKQPDNKTDFKLPTWVYCTRYSDRPSAGPRCRRKVQDGLRCRRKRTSFTEYQLSVLQDEFIKCRYLSEESRHKLAAKLALDVSKIKVWFQNRRANAKKMQGVKNSLALRLMAEGLYDHSTRPLSSDGLSSN